MESCLKYHALWLGLPLYLLGLFELLKVGCTKVYCILTQSAFSLYKHKQQWKWGKYICYVLNVGIICAIMLCKVLFNYG